LRIEYPGAIHHVISRGNLRRSVLEDERDCQRLLEGLEQTVGRFGWDLFSFVLMPNHFHLFLRTPQLNLSRGMQYLVSGYAKRRQCTGDHGGWPDRRDLPMMV
jgi:putative transposase